MIKYAILLTPGNPEKRFNDSIDEYLSYKSWMKTTNNVFVVCSLFDSPGEANMYIIDNYPIQQHNLFKIKKVICFIEDLNPSSVSDTDYVGVGEV